MAINLNQVVEPSPLPIQTLKSTTDGLDEVQHVNVDNAPGLTDVELRATPVPVSGTVATGGLTDTELRASPVPVSGPLTDTQLRATPVPVSGTVSTGGLTDTELRATPVPVSGPLTDTQLRATPVPISGTVTATGPLTDTQLRATPVPVSGTVTATGPLTDTQLRATPVPVSGPLTDTQLRATPVPVSGTVTATGPLTDTQLRASAVPVSNAAASQVDGHSSSIGATTDADTALTVIGRLKKLLTLLPAALVGGRLDTNIGAWLGSTAPTVGQKTAASSVPVVLASDQPAIPNPTTSTGNSIGVIVSNASPTLIVAAGTRKFILMVNDDSVGVYVSHDPLVAISGAKRGHYLAPRGGSLMLPDTGAWYGLADAAIATENITYSELA